MHIRHPKPSLNPKVKQVHFPNHNPKPNLNPKPNPNPKA